MNCWKPNTFETWFSKDFTFSSSRMSLFVIDPPLKYSLPQTTSAVLQRHTHTHTHARSCLVCLIVCHWWQHGVLFLWDQRRVAASLNLSIRWCSCHLSPSLSVASLHRMACSPACISPSVFHWQSVHPLLSLFLWLIRIGGRGTLE